MLRIQISENEYDETNGKLTPEFTLWEAAATAALKILYGITSVGAEEALLYSVSTLASYP